MIPRIILYFDGACGPKNPGGYATGGWIIYESQETTGDERREVHRGYMVFGEGEGSTNNYAEYCALGRALRWLSDEKKRIEAATPDQTLAIGELIIYGDSNLVIKQITGAWSVKEPMLQKLNRRCRELLEYIAPAKRRALHIMRDLNEECDVLSKRAFETRETIELWELTRGVESCKRISS